MTCATDYQTAVHANADNAACAEMEVNEQALDDLLNLGEALFSNTWLALGEVMEEALKRDKEKFIELLVEVEFAQHNRLTTYAGLKQQQHEFYKEVALAMNEMASSH